MERQPTSSIDMINDFRLASSFNQTFCRMSIRGWWSGDEITKQLMAKDKRDLIKESNWFLCFWYRTKPAKWKKLVEKQLSGLIMVESSWRACGMVSINFHKANLKSLHHRFGISSKNQIDEDDLRIETALISINVNHLTKVLIWWMAVWFVALVVRHSFHGGLKVTNYRRFSCRIICQVNRWLSRCYRDPMTWNVGYEEIK